MRFFNKPTPVMVDSDRALPGRSASISIPERHAVLGTPMLMSAEYLSDHNYGQIILAMGCFWGAERKFWNLPGVYSTAVGYAGGYTPNPTYEEVCTGLTGHTEVVLVTYIPDEISLQSIMAVFWESHDPTQVMRQGNDVGTQYRSAVYVLSDGDMDIVVASQKAYAQQLEKAGLDPIATEIRSGQTFYYAEPYHQQYLHKNPTGYCGLVSAAQGGRPAFPC